MGSTMYHLVQGTSSAGESIYARDVWSDFGMIGINNLNFEESLDSDNADTHIIVLPLIFDKARYQNIST